MALARTEPGGHSIRSTGRVDSPQHRPHYPSGIPTAQRRPAWLLQQVEPLDALAMVVARAWVQVDGGAQRERQRVARPGILNSALGEQAVEHGCGGVGVVANTHMEVVDPIHPGTRPADRAERVPGAGRTRPPRSSRYRTPSRASEFASLEPDRMPASRRTSEITASVPKTQRSDTRCSVRPTCSAAGVPAPRNGSSAWPRTRTMAHRFRSWWPAFGWPLHRRRQPTPGSRQRWRAPG